MKRFLKQSFVFLFVFALINIVILIIYEIPAYKAIKNKTHKNFLKWTDIHQNKESYDLVILGSSRAYTAYNPDIIDQSLNLKSYNMGTSAQDIAESYHMLQEILEYQKPQYLVLDLFFPSSDNSHDFYQIFSNASFFNSNKIKYDLVTTGYGESGITNYLLPVVKFKNYIKSDLSKLMRKNSGPKQETNWIRGFLYDTVTVSKKGISKFTPVSNYQNTSFDKSRLNNYFNKIRTLAEANNIKLICVRSPYPPTRFALNEIDDEGNFFKKFTKEEGIPFYDFNSKNTANTYLDQDFSDYHHTNYRGADKATKQLVKFINQLSNEE